jgi:hypothetical protein
MIAMSTHSIWRRDRRTLAFRALAALAIVALLVTDGIGLAAPWLDLTSYRAPDYQAAIHRWHEAQQGTYAGILLIGSMLALLWRPRGQPLLLLFLALSGGALALSAAPFAPRMALGSLALLALLVITSPDRRARLGFAGPARPSLALLALGLLAAALLATEMWRSLQLQLAAADAHAQGGHWARSAILALALALAGLLAATKRPGWEALGLLTGAGLIYLGLAAVTLPDQAGSWNRLGGALATLGGWAFVGATLWEARRSRRQAPQAPGHAGNALE